MILIEGPDKVGKTTLARKLARFFKCPCVAYGPMPTWWNELDYCLRLMTFAVYDRYHWSSFAYREVSPQPWPVTLEACVEIDKALKSRCSNAYTKILIVSENPSFFDDKPDDMFSTEQVKQVNQNFLDIRSQFDLVLAPYPNFDEVIARDLLFR